MSLPLPRTVADVGPGGPLVTAMSGINALNNEMIMRKINAIKAQYAPITAQAEAASKLAYANLMGPQFLAKIMGNDSALGNLSEDQKKMALEKIYQAGSGQGTGANIFNQMRSGIGQPSTNSLSGWLSNKLKNAFDYNASPQNGNAMNTPYTGYDNSNNPGVSAEGPGPIDSGSPFVGREGYKAPKNDTINHEVDAAFDDWLQTPEGRRELLKGENANMPSAEEVVQWKRNKDGGVSMKMDLVGGRREPTYAEKAATYKGVLREGEKLGEIRATSKKELDQDYQQALQLKQPFQKLASIIRQPKFQKLRELPGFQNLQMNVKSKIGDAEEQKLIGEFQAAAQNIVAATVKGFGGRILASEIPLAESMKLNANDTIGVMMGKAPVIEEFNEMTLQRSRLASKLMKDYHLDKGDALEEADKMIDGEAIRRQVQQDLSLEPTEEDYRHTAEKYNISVDEVKKRLAAKRGQ